jgi:PII-like signaling protein
MTTLVIKGNNIHSRKFLEYARSLPYIDVVDNNKNSIRKFKPEVQEALLASERGEGLTEYGSVDEMFKQLGI